MSARDLSAEYPALSRIAVEIYSHIPVQGRTEFRRVIDVLCGSTAMLRDVVGLRQEHVTEPLEVSCTLCPSPYDKGAYLVTNVGAHPDTHHQVLSLAKAQFLGATLTDIYANALNQGTMVVSAPEVDDPDNPTTVRFKVCTNIVVSVSRTPAELMHHRVKGLCNLIRRMPVSSDALLKLDAQDKALYEYVIQA